MRISSRLFASIATVILCSCSNLIISKPLTGVTRQEKDFFGAALLSKYPRIALIDEQLFLAVSEFNEKGAVESLKIGSVQVPKGDSPFFSLTDLHLENIFTSQVASHPHFLKNHSDELFITWCGSSAEDVNSKNRLQLWIKKIYPKMEPENKISTVGSFPCNADFAFENNLLHIVYEQSLETNMNIAYQVFNTLTGVIQESKILSRTFMARRPKIKINSTRALVVWDEWKPSPWNSGTADPTYQIRGRFLEKKKWSKIQDFSQGAGIHAAPDLLASGEEFYLTYHHSAREEILKEWSVFKIDAANNLFKVEISNPLKNNNNKEENQGAEFPQLWGTYQSGLILSSRPSHGSFLHIISGNKLQNISLDLDEWGARDIYMDAVLDGNVLYLVRRGHKQNHLEKFQLNLNLEPMTFIPVRRLNSKANDLLPLPKKRTVLGQFRTLFGDVHMHSALSDGTGPADEIYARAFEYGLDFAILTEHDNIVGSRLFPSQYIEVKVITDLFNSIPGFTTIQAYEWTTPVIPRGSGHKNIYFKAQAPNPVFSYKYNFSNTPLLYQQLINYPVFTAPHHTSWTGTDWEYADPKIQRHFEINSVHGLFESDLDNPLKEFTRGEFKGFFARDGLANDQTFGFLAGSDGHGLPFHHGHGRFRNPWIHGLTGVLLNLKQKITRQTLWQAMYDRRTFASTGKRMVAMASITQDSSKLKIINGQESALNGPFNLNIEIKGTRPLTEIIVVQNGRQIREFYPNKEEKVFKHTISFEKLQKGRHNFYIRAKEMHPNQGHDHVHQMDFVYSSPIFVNWQ